MRENVNSSVFPNVYQFDSINEFSQNRGKIQSTMKGILPFMPKRRFEGLAFVEFNHRLAFNYRIIDGTTDISDMCGGENSFPVSFKPIKIGYDLIGFTLDKIKEDTKLDREEQNYQMTLSDSLFIFSQKTPDFLTLYRYEINDAPVGKMVHHRMSRRDGTGST